MYKFLLLSALLLVTLTGLSVRGCHMSRLYEEEEENEVRGASRVRREVTLDERSNCPSDHDQPLNRVNTSNRVSQLRAEMAQLGLDAYIIPTDDEHQSEYVAPADERRRYISGFSGSAGTAVVTSTQQALWTDGRYFLQADQQMDCDWLLMKHKNLGVPNMMDWLREVLAEGSRVGADPRLIGAESWISYAEDLAKSNIELVAEENNLIDKIWPVEERPQYSEDPIIVHELKFAGKKWEDKVAEVREEMIKAGADLMVVTALDEVAWLLNLRGSDIPYNPVFRAYVIIRREGVELYLPSNKIITPHVDLHLHINHCETQECVTIHDYATILSKLKSLSMSNHIKKVMIGGKYSYSGGASYAVYSAVPEPLRLKVTSPVLLKKARKNSVETAGMTASHVRDAVALCDFLAYLEKEIKDGRYWSEISAAERLTEYRSQQSHFMGISFSTISAYGDNGAVIHYIPEQETNKQISIDSLYLLDSGGQYKDGTTDVTRTMHYGTPTAFQIEAYTRVLMGAVDLASLIFPQGTGDSDVDIIARRHLYEVGLDYRHGTGHGIGHYLNVHEAPIQVRIYGRDEHSFEVGHFFSDASEVKNTQKDFFGSHEPGFYKDGEFGIRLENIMRVVEKDTKYHFDKQSLGFEAVTLVPYEANLINVSMLSPQQCEWINTYHAYVRDVIGGQLMQQNKTQGHDWLIIKTEPLPCVESIAVIPTGKSSTDHAALIHTAPETAARRRRRELQQQKAPVQTPLQELEKLQEEGVKEEEKPYMGANRTLCEPGDVEPHIRVNTSLKVAAVRREMETYNFDGYIIPMEGEQGDGLAAEMRLSHITGFTGSSGIAVVTSTMQALWTDGRYFLQADNELDCDWLLMKAGIDGVPKLTEWLGDALPEGATVGADSRLVASDTWKKFVDELTKSNITMVAQERNLVDAIWEGRPSYPSDPIYIHDMRFAGKRWEDKVAEVRAEMIEAGADLLVVTAMDEVAWLLNLRGSDTKSTPVFRGYVFLGRNDVELFVPAEKITPAVDLHLHVNHCQGQECVIITPYTDILDRLRALKFKANITKVMLPKKYSYSEGASYAVYSAVPEEKRLVQVSPVLKMKARKNDVESQGMKAAHLRDAVALCEFLSFMEREINSGQPWDEIEAASKLRELRSQQDNYMGNSFDTISAYGSNGAVIHYRPRADTNMEITKDSLYLLDSGGQYKDGTTDVTRTMHYGTPTPFQIEAYTRVLMGAVDLASLIFPQGTGDSDVDIVARRALFEVGLDYRHGTGHGIGHFLGVHEAPTQVRIYGDEEHELEIGQFFSDEPGYYQDGEWGIRLETILTVVPTHTKYTWDKPFLGFEPVTLVPFEAKLIDLTILSDDQCWWVNDYHARVRDEVGLALVSEGRQEAHDWLVTKTEPLPCQGSPPQTTTHRTTIKTQTPWTASSSTARQQSTSPKHHSPMSEKPKKVVLQMAAASGAAKTTAPSILLMCFIIVLFRVWCR